MGAVPLPAVIGGLLLGLALLASPAAGEVPDAVRVVTFNLLHGGPASGLSGDDEHLDARLRLVARELQWWGVLIALALFVALRWIHPAWIGGFR